MEFKLNKIDTDLRQKINAETSEGKIHTKKGISVNKDKNKDARQDSNKKGTDEKFSVSKYTGAKDKFTVETVKVQNIEVQAVREENSNDEKNYKGSFIDSRR